MATKDLRANRQIRAYEVRLIDENGVQCGIVKLNDALQRAEEAGLDLVEVSPNVTPPVCKILDFGKYRYEMEKKQREAKKNQAVIKIKEIRMQPKIDKHDLDTKSKAIGGFLNEGNKVKVSIRFRGRELAHPELGRVVLDRILDILDENKVGYSVDRAPIMEGKMMSMSLSPVKGQGSPKKQQ